MEQVIITNWVIGRGNFFEIVVIIINGNHFEIGVMVMNFKQ